MRRLASGVPAKRARATWLFAALLGSIVDGLETDDRPMGLERDRKLDGDALSDLAPGGPVGRPDGHRRVSGDHETSCVSPARNLGSSYLNRTSPRLTEKLSSPEKTRCTVRPSSLIHLTGRQDVSPGPTSHSREESTVVQGPQGSGAS